MLNIKPFKQTDDSRCAPACIKMVLSHYGIEATEDELCKLANHTYELGCTNANTKKCLEGFGIEVMDKEYGTLEDLQKAIYCGTPAIVDWLKDGVGHYSIVAEISNGNITLIDPEEGEYRTMGVKDFMRLWFDWEQTEYISKDNLVIRYLMICKK